MYEEHDDDVYQCQLMMKLQKKLKKILHKPLWELCHQFNSCYCVEYNLKVTELMNFK